MGKYEVMCVSSAYKLYSGQIFWDRVEIIPLPLSRLHPVRPFSCKYKHTHTHTHTHMHTHTNTEDVWYHQMQCLPFKSMEFMCGGPVHTTHTSPVHTSHQSSTYITPIQYIQYISPVQHRHQSCTFITHVRVKCRPITIDSVWIMVSLPTQLDLGFRISNTGIPKAKKFRALNRWFGLAIGHFQRYFMCS